METITKDAAKFWANYFNSTEHEALQLNDLTIDCMVKFAKQETIQQREELKEAREFIKKCTYAEHELLRKDAVNHLIKYKK